MSIEFLPDPTSTPALTHKQKPVVPTQPKPSPALPQRLGVLGPSPVRNSNRSRVARAIIASAKAQYNNIPIDQRKGFARQLTGA